MSRFLFTHLSEAPWQEIKEAGGLFGIEGKATLSRSHPPFIFQPKETTTAWKVHPKEVIPSNEYQPEEPGNPDNVILYEISLPAPENTEPPARFLDRQNNFRPGKLRFLPLDRCVAAFNAGPELKQVIDSELYSGIQEPRITAVLVHLLPKQEFAFITPGLRKKTLAKSLAELLIENRLRLIRRDVTRLFTKIDWGKLSAVSPAPYKFGLGVNRGETCRDFLIRRRESLAQAELSSPHLQRYRRLLLHEVNQRLRDLM